ncbi:unnamed protein product (macronuclear) [Paramecium tetraurelia]|uniref:Uncharacterized protein n=1 Tax=Paramecium tetraurelia TaxID=5888 RepID=A0EFP6_PARTE|nr:uncharacterized protein GSPATT00026460001 [Paramecium tetraurelia]CAK94137.1 unnamed protein product [Paramecium tetraurelia]|eukprot:XP_001461510.1 hypothetical protein (macronuclear) [Paramecium tetraurelia strain d4-2]
MTTPLKQKFNIEDGSESEQEETQKKSSENQPLFQTSLFSSLPSNSKSLKKKPLAKLTLQDFLTNYDQNFDDVFGEKELPQTQDQVAKKKKKKTAKKKKHQSDSESEYKSLPKVSKKKQNADSEQSNEKQMEPSLTKQSTSKNQKKHRLTKIDSSKLTSEEKSNEVKRYDPNCVDLPENTKADKKNFKLRKFLFSFGLEQQNPDDDQEQEEEKEEQVEEQKESVNSKNTKKKSNQISENKDNQIEQLDIDKIENNNKKRKQPKKTMTNSRENEKQKQQQREQKQPEIDPKTMLNLDTLKLNVYIPECNPKDNDNDINQ